MKLKYEATMIILLEMNKKNNFYFCNFFQVFFLVFLNEILIILPFTDINRHGIIDIPGVSSTRVAAIPKKAKSNDGRRATCSVSTTLQQESNPLTTSSISDARWTCLGTHIYKWCLQTYYHLKLIIIKLTFFLLKYVKIRKMLIKILSNYIHYLNN